jgi:hypothetical protein
MAEARLQAEIADTKAEDQRLKDPIFRGTVQKNLSIVSQIPKWSGSFVESNARIGNCSDQDFVQVATLKLTDKARIFYSIFYSKATRSHGINLKACSDTHFVMSTLTSIILLSYIQPDRVRMNPPKNFRTDAEDCPKS